MRKINQKAWSFPLLLHASRSWILAGHLAAMPTKWEPFSDGPISIEERFEERGRKRQDEVWRIYVTQDDAAAPFFDGSG